MRWKKSHLSLYAGGAERRPAHGTEHDMIDRMFMVLPMGFGLWKAWERIRAACELRREG